MKKKNSKLRIGIIGLGYWGPNLVKSFVDNPNCEIVVLCDSDLKRLEAIHQIYGQIAITTDSDAVFKNNSVDAVVISTPTKTHFYLARKALSSGKHVLLEKPMATTVEECEKLNEISSKKNLRLMVGHVFLFNPGIQYIADLIRKGDLGEIIYAYSTRVNLGPIRSDVNVLYDLAPHDISIFNHWLGNEPISVQASGLTYLQPGIEDVAFVSLRYPTNIMVNLHVGWLDPRKTRQIVVVGTKKMVVFDDLSPLGSVQIYDKSVRVTDDRSTVENSVQAFKAIIQEGTLLIPKISMGEPLKEECKAFVNSVLNGASTLSDGNVGTSVVRVLEMATKSLKNKGAVYSLMEKEELLSLQLAA